MYRDICLGLLGDSLLAGKPARFIHNKLRRTLGGWKNVPAGQTINPRLWCISIVICTATSLYLVKNYIFIAPWLCLVIHFLLFLEWLESLEYYCHGWQKKIMLPSIIGHFSSEDTGDETNPSNQTWLFLVTNLYYWELYSWFLLHTLYHWSVDEFLITNHSIC